VGESRRLCRSPVTPIQVLELLALPDARGELIDRLRLIALRLK